MAWEGGKGNLVVVHQTLLCDFSLPQLFGSTVVPWDTREFRHLCIRGWHPSRLELHGCRGCVQDGESLLGQNSLQAASVCGGSAAHSLGAPLLHCCRSILTGVFQATFYATGPSGSDPAPALPLLQFWGGACHKFLGTGREPAMVLSHRQPLLCDLHFLLLSPLALLGLHRALFLRK